MTARPAYRDVSLYANEKISCAVDLSDNTNLWGMPPAATKAAAVAAVTATRYPTVYAHELKAAMATYLGVSPAMIVTGCGSDDVLDSAIRALAEPGERFAHPDPSFPMAATFARMNALVPVPIPLTGDWDADADAFLSTNARLIYLCSPNNPNGRSLTRATVDRIVTNAPGFVILDEAYAEFADRSDVDLLTRTDRVLVTRTMSKAFGLAGLRVGYAAGAPALVAEVEKSRGPYKVNVIAERAALAALTDDRAWVDTHIALVRENRARFRMAIDQIGYYETLPTDANFVLIASPVRRLQNATELAQRMGQRGVAVRPYTGLRGIGEAIRVTVGPWNQMNECCNVLHTVTHEMMATK